MSASLAAGSPLDGFHAGKDLPYVPMNRGIVVDHQDRGSVAEQSGLATDQDTGHSGLLAFHAVGRIQSPVSKTAL